jgi:hypothetical protein
MDTKKKAIIVSAILIGLGGYYIYMNMKNKPAVQVPETPENTIDTTKVLSKGSTGEEVKSLQKALGGGLKVDGVFGALTENRLKSVTGKISISLREYNALIISKSKK